MFGTMPRQSSQINTADRLAMPRGTSVMFETAHQKFISIQMERPEEAELFALIDREWRALMQHVRRNPAVIASCSKPGLLQNLKNMRKVWNFLLNVWILCV